MAVKNSDQSQKALLGTILFLLPDGSEQALVFAQDRKKVFTRILQVEENNEFCSHTFNKETVAVVIPDFLHNGEHSLHESITYWNTCKNLKDLLQVGTFNSFEEILPFLQSGSRGREARESLLEKLKFTVQIVTWLSAAFCEERIFKHVQNLLQGRWRLEGKCPELCIK